MHLGMPLASFLAAVLVLVPLPAHWRAKNIATLTIIAWLFVINVIQGVNAILWAHSVEIRAVVWCDITTRVFIGSNIGLSAACFCLCMNLERVAAVRTVRLMQSDKRRRLIIDCLICFAVPALYTGLYYVVQGHRFDIVEDFGCRPETYVSIPEFFLIRLPPVVLDLGTLILSAMAFVHFMRRRATFMTHLASAKSTLTPSRYLRLMAMAMVEMFWDLLITIMNMVFSYRDGLRPWISWADVHSNFSRIGLFPTLLISSEDLRMTIFLWWALPVSAYLFFLFFAFGQDAMNEYRSALDWARRVIFRKSPREATTFKDSLPSLPTYSISYTDPHRMSTSMRSQTDISIPSPLTPHAEKESAALDNENVPASPPPKEPFDHQIVVPPMDGHAHTDTFHHSAAPPSYSASDHPVSSRIADVGDAV